MRDNESPAKPTRLRVEDSVGSTRATDAKMLTEHALVGSPAEPGAQAIYIL
jgi:hypothetical protein